MRAHLLLQNSTIHPHRLLLRLGVSMLASQRPHAPTARIPSHLAHAAALGQLAVRAVSNSSGNGTSAHAAADASLLQAASWRLALLEATQNQRVDKELRIEFSWALRLKGVTFDNMQGHPTQALVQQLQPGQGLVFCQDSSNPADPHAVAVFTAGMQHLGYVPAHAAQLWRLQTCFGRVVSAGRAADSGNWGATVQANPFLHGITMDLLPDSWAQAADLQQVLGPQAWFQMQDQVREQYRQRCAISSMPAHNQQEQQLHVLPQWGFDQRHKRVQLAGLLPVCQTLLELQQQLAAAADTLAHLSPSLQLPYELPEAATAAAANTLQQQQEQVQGQDLQQQQQQVDPTSLHTGAAALHAAQAAAAADAVAALPADQQAAIKLLAFFNQFTKHTPWAQVDCVRYLAHAGWRKQQLLLQGGWQLVQPDAQQVAALLQSTAATASGTPATRTAAAAAAAAVTRPLARRAVRPQQGLAQQQAGAS